MSNRQIIVECAEHHRELSERLWNMFLTKGGVDFGLVWGGRWIGTHRFLLDLFLSSEKLAEYGASVQPDENCHLLESLMEFLYTGRLTVMANQLPTLLDLAKRTQFVLLLETLQNTAPIYILDSSSNVYIYIPAEMSNRQIVVECARHHLELSARLWRMFLTKYGVDLGVVWGGRWIGTHGFLLDLFLSTENLAEYGASMLPDEDCHSLESLLQFLYTGRLTVDEKQFPGLFALTKYTQFTLLLDALHQSVPKHLWNSSYKIFRTKKMQIAMNGTSLLATDTEMNHPDMEIANHAEMQFVFLPEMNAAIHPEMDAVSYPGMDIINSPGVGTIDNPNMENIYNPEMEILSNAEFGVAAHSEITVVHRPSHGVINDSTIEMVNPRETTDKHSFYDIKNHSSIDQQDYLADSSLGHLGVENSAQSLWRQSAHNVNLKMEQEIEHLLKPEVERSCVRPAGIKQEPPDQGYENNYSGAAASSPVRQYRSILRQNCNQVREYPGSSIQVRNTRSRNSEPVKREVKRSQTYKTDGRLSRQAIESMKRCYVVLTPLSNLQISNATVAKSRAAKKGTDQSAPRRIHETKTEDADWLVTAIKKEPISSQNDPAVGRHSSSTPLPIPIENVQAEAGRPASPAIRVASVWSYQVSTNDAPSMEPLDHPLSGPLQLKVYDPHVQRVGGPIAGTDSEGATWNEPDNDVESFLRTASESQLRSLDDVIRNFDPDSERTAAATTPRHQSQLQWPRDAIHLQLPATPTQPNELRSATTVLVNDSNRMPPSASTLTSSSGPNVGPQVTAGVLTEVSCTLPFAGGELGYLSRWPPIQPRREEGTTAAATMFPWVSSWSYTLEVPPAFRTARKRYEQRRERARTLTDEVSSNDGHPVDEPRAATVKQYACPVCSASFNRLDQLRCHFGSHSHALRSVKCRICPMTFSRDSSRQEHEKSHVVKEAHKCHRCDMSFASMADLIVHRITGLQNGRVCNRK